MKNNFKTTLLMTIPILLMMMLSLEPISASVADYEWQEDELYVWGYTSWQRMTTDLNEDNQIADYYSTMQQNYHYRVDKYTESSCLLNYTYWDLYTGIEAENWMNTSSALIDYYFFRPYFYWDYDDEQLYLTGFSYTSYYNYIRRFLEPNWEVINDNWKRTTFNDSSLAVAYDNGTHTVNVTMGDFFNDYTANYTVMGEDNLSGGIGRITDDTHSWNFTLILDDKIYYDADPSYTGTNMKAYKTYRFSIHIAYTEGGILSEHTYDRSYTTKDTTFEYHSRLINSPITVGPAPSTGVSGFDLPVLLILGAFGLISVPVIKFMRNKRL